ncbi:MAG: NIPSNAP family protein [Prevotella sp.]|nr:NIPSNAP family protein [Prevotella sp.]
MERRKFMKLAGALAMTPSLSAIPAVNNLSESLKSKKKEIYEWRIYTLIGDGGSLDTFFADTLFPAYKRKGITAGAFKLFRQKEGEKEQRHILFIYPDIETFHKVKKEIRKDSKFTQTAQKFYDESAINPLYSNFETYIGEAFDKIPVYRKPDGSRTLFEIRIYRSPNEEANQRKVKMFNLDEIDIFDKVGINSVLYGDILAGPRMPALLYLTWYKDEPTRTEAWSKFSDHPDWKRISKLPEYAHTATNNQSIFLAPLPYSQL